MKIMVSGMTSAQANPAASVKSVTFAWMLTEALREAGHDVDFCNPDVEASLNEYDRVFIGLAPLHGLGSNRAYGALSAILRTIGDGRLTLFIDDPDLGKVVSGIRTNVANPNRFTKAFFEYKLQYDIANSPRYKDWLASGIRILNENAWPQLLVPVHAWAEDSAIAYYEKQAPQAAGNVRSVDLSAYLPVFTPSADETTERERQWITEDKPFDRWIVAQRPQLPIKAQRRNFDGKLPDQSLVALYRKSMGVLQSPIKPVGWWHARIGYAAQAGAVYCTKWQDVQILGDAYTQLPDRVELMDDDQLAEIASAQKQAFTAHSPDKSAVQDRLASILDSTGVPA